MVLTIVTMGTVNFLNIGNSGTQNKSTRQAYSNILRIRLMTTNSGIRLYEMGIAKYVGMPSIISIIRIYTRMILELVLKLR